MIRIHREGKKILLRTLLILALINIAVFTWVELEWVETLVLIASLIVYLLVLQFFRNPKRFFQVDDHKVLAPADG